MALTEREKKILRLNAEGMSDYRIARKLKMETPNVTRSRKNALRKLEYAKADLEFAGNLKSIRNTTAAENRSRP
jgi:DNA-binding NarL/FixJ family response regulator